MPLPSPSRTEINYLYQSFLIQYPHMTSNMMTEFLSGLSMSNQNKPGVARTMHVKVTRSNNLFGLLFRELFGILSLAITSRFYVLCVLVVSRIL